MSLRREFVELALREGANRRELARRFEISPTTGYKWLVRYQAQGPAGLAERSRRPRHSPRRTSEALERAVVELRDEHSAWGGRKLRRRLQSLGHAVVPAASTITQIVRRSGRALGQLSAPSRSASSTNSRRSDMAERSLHTSTPSQRPVRRCPPCLRTPVHHVPGLYKMLTGEGPGRRPGRWWRATRACAMRPWRRTT